MLGKNKDDQFVTKKDLEETLEKTLDKALASQSKVILEAVDYGFRKNDKKFEGIDRQFEVAAERFDKIDKKFEKVDEQIKEKFDKVLSGQDKICKQLTDLQTENKSGMKIYKRQDKKLENHKRRIERLELKLSV
ncbi:hypothetical protein KKF19_00030 [Patescibacteria group bacterium]|nr:hypothetical protein [Patescibacteria group bacterium]